MEKIIKTTISLMLMLALSLPLTACGEVREVPELVTPLSENRSFRKVSRQNLGEIKAEIGHIVPQEYCHYFKRATTLKDISCTLGDYVEEGQVLAVADTETMLEELDEIKASYELLIAEQSYKDQIHDTNLKILNTKRQKALYSYDDEGTSAYTTEIRKEEENKLYDDTLYTFMLDYYQNEMDEINKDIEEATIRAKHSGYVMYVKDTSKESRVVKDEAVIIVADFDDTYIELSNVNIGNNIYKRYAEKYALIEGREIPIEEYEFTPQETTVARAQETYPNVRYKMVEPVDLEVGDTITLCFRLNQKSNVLAVGRDSINTDETGSYVYVRGEGDSLEKRYVETSYGDNFYAEVVSGLTEGEEVYYTQESMAPTKYTSYVVSTTNFTQNKEGKFVKKAAVINKAYFAKANGKITSINVSTDTKVNKGDTLMVIDSGGGSAELEEVDMQIEHIQLDFAKMIKDTDKQITDLKTSNLRLLTTIEEGKYNNSLSERDIDLIECDRTVYTHQAEIAEFEKQINALEYEDSLRKLLKRAEKLKKNNNGQGKISIVAEDDGVVSRLYVTEGKMTEIGGENYLLASVTRESDTLANISVSKTTGVPHIGQKIEITDKLTEKKYTGTVVSGAYEGKSFGFTEEGRAHVSFCRGTSETSFNVRMDDSAFFEEINMNSCNINIVDLYMPSSIVLDVSVVNFEESKSKSEKLAFVWKVEGDELVKHYINTGANYGIGNYSTVYVLTGVSEGDVLAKTGGGFVVQ